MKSLLKWFFNINASTLALMLIFAFPIAAYADEKLSVSITPPLFQLTIGPGEFWASTLKVINSNSYDVTYYASVVNFEASGEGGTGKFVPLIEDSVDEAQHAYSLARWVDITKEGIMVPKGQSKEIPFTVSIPETAEPGGHYAAILVGTQPPRFDNQDGPTVSVSSYVSSLLFVRIKGDVIEKGRIREFITENELYQKPEANFVLRFENTGTTHLQPQGNITIYNMWGKERGMLAINQKTNFGNVLPASTRKFEFMWKGDANPYDIGRYSAVTTLTFGDELKQNVSATTYFWVVPVFPVILTLFGFFGMVFSATFLIRRYIRHVLALEHERSVAIENIVYGAPEPSAHITLQALALPLKEGVVDLRSMKFQKEEKVLEEQILSPEPSDLRGGYLAPRNVSTPRVPSTITPSEFLSKYRLFFLFLLLVIIGSSLFAWYFGNVLVPARTYEISNIQTQDEVLLDTVKDVP